jgi:hypothetical protein
MGIHNESIIIPFINIFKYNRNKYRLIIPTKMCRYCGKVNERCIIIDVRDADNIKELEKGDVLKYDG